MALERQRREFHCDLRCFREGQLCSLNFLPENVSNLDFKEDRECMQFVGRAAPVMSFERMNFGHEPL